MSAPFPTILLRRFFSRQDLFVPSPAARLATYAVLAAWTLVVLVPLYWVAVTSLKIRIVVDSGPFYVPFLDFIPSIENWRYIFVDLGRDTLRPYLNSVVVALSSTVLSVLIGSLASYALVRMQFRVKIAAIVTFLALLSATVGAIAFLSVPWPAAMGAAVALFVLFLATLARRFRRALGNRDIEFWMISNRIMPPVVAVLPIYLMFQNFRLLDTQVALIATYTAINLPIVVWLTRDFFAGIPVELDESAEIDGASKFRIFFTIALPLVRPGLVATFLLVLILAWNEYLLALFLSNANAQTMPILVSAQNGTRGPEWGYMSVLIVIMIAPVVAITVLLQKQIARGLLVGAMKG
jgi:multiple sugar transport system permease protein